VSSVFGAIYRESFCSFPKIARRISTRHGTSLVAKVRSIMHAPVAPCDERSLLSDAIRHMFLKDVQRLYAYAGEPSYIVGVLSLSDAAQICSGSCRACVASRAITAP
jgi:hypothetical protein